MLKKIFLGLRYHKGLYILSILLFLFFNVIAFPNIFAQNTPPADISEVSKTSVRIVHIKMPEISYNRRSLDELIAELPATPNLVDKLADYLTTIEEQLLAIKSFQTKTNPADFYEKMNDAVIKIRNITHEIYETTSIYDAVLANKLRKLLLGWIEPFAKELHNRISMSENELETLTLKTKRLYAQQSFIVRQELFKEELKAHLHKLNHLLMQPGKPQPRCYMRAS